LAIPDYNMTGLSSTINLPINSTIIDVNVEVDVKHTYLGDLVIDLEHLGTFARLLSRPNSPIVDCFEDDIIATFDDEATVEAHTMCNTTVPAIEGNVTPFGSLDVFNNFDATGLWTLLIVDNGNADYGNLNSWCLQITTAGNQCYDKLTNANGLSQIEITNADYESSDWISTSLPTTLETGSSVDYDAVQFIELNPSFEVKIGATFTAIIDGCNNGNSGSN